MFRQCFSELSELLGAAFAFRLFSPFRPLPARLLTLLFRLPAHLERDNVSHNVRHAA
jgi:hypothetical protein